MIAGLAFQVATLFTFMLFSLDFFIRVHRLQNLDMSPTMVELRTSLRFKAFLAALALATICIFWRSVYRVAELAEGWTGELIKKQNLFVAFEGVMVVVAVLVLNVAHPAWCFADRGRNGENEEKSEGSSQIEMVGRK